MKISRSAFVLLLALCAAPAWADELNIGLTISAYPQLVPVPGYPVYYAPEVRANYFFYDGDYWLFENDNWYQSPWYDGPWERVRPEDVPDVVLQIPIRYYVAPPAFFFSWIITDHPHWGEHWGHDWERRRHGWDRHDRREMHDRPAPLPDYQRHYSGDRYPRERERQHDIQHRNYRYLPHPPVIRQQPQMPVAPASPGVNRPPAPGNAPQDMPQREHARELGAAAQPGTVRREPAARRNQGDGRRQEREDREGWRGQQQERARDR